MRRQNIHTQIGNEESLMTPNHGARETKERVIRRLVVEVIKPMALWAEEKDPISKEAIQRTARKESHYEKVMGWEEILEEFLGKSVEIIILKDPMEIKTLTRGSNPIIQRLLEMGQEAAEETLLAAWHREHGILAGCWPGEFPGHGITPKVKTLASVWENEEDACIWWWDRKNFKTSE